MNNEIKFLHPERSEMEIIEEIIRSKKQKVDDYYPGWLIYTLSYGSKTLEVRFKPDRREAGTYIENTKESSERLENETTLLYKAVKIILQDFVFHNNLSVDYFIRTENEHIRDWAKNRGEQIFHWDNVEEYKDENFPTLYVFKKMFQPEKNNLETN